MEKLFQSGGLHKKWKLIILALQSTTAKLIKGNVNLWEWYYAGRNEYKWFGFDAVIPDIKLFLTIKSN